MSAPLCRAWGEPPSWSRLPYRVVETGFVCPVHELRAVGVREARGEYVALIEDHVHLSPDWTAQILARVDEGWAAISGSVQPGNEKTPLSACFGLWDSIWELSASKPALPSSPW